jgi:hypothetical protein
LARRAADRLPPGPLADAVLAYEEFLLAGAVAHDSPYYQLGDAEAKRTADRLHGAGGHDSFDPFRNLATYRQGLGAPAFAFGLGALTHLAADVTFHPMVFSWTGDADAPDPEARHGWMYRHQACETALDLHLEALWRRAPIRTYAKLVRRAGPSLIAIQGAWAQGDAKPWISAQSQLQGLFRYRTVGALARLLAWKNPAGEGDWSAGFYPGRPVFHPAFLGALEWVDPVTGAPGRATLEDLVDRFDSFAADLAAEWTRAWLEGTEPFAGAVGPALDTAVPTDRDQTKRHFDLKWF